ncbi:MAG: Ribosome maturation factor RimM [Syntrophus sp. SKADARSKE-3]|nr:Ribosome maturation factor RimM [Syntrophus sp. SKADARSKE-3]
MLNKIFEIGEIVKIQGLRGQVKLNSFLVEPEKTLSNAGEVFLHRRGVEKGPLRILAFRVYKHNVFLDLEGIDDVEAAESLVGFTALVSRDSLDPLPDDEYYWQDLIGMTIVTEEGEILGHLSSIFSTGGNDVYVCTGDGGEMLIPAIADVVLDVDMEGRKMGIRILKGMDRPC